MENKIIFDLLVSQPDSSSFISLDQSSLNYSNEVSKFSGLVMV